MAPHKTPEKLKTLMTQVKKSATAVMTERRKLQRAQLQCGKKLQKLESNIIKKNNAIIEKQQEVSNMTQILYRKREDEKIAKLSKKSNRKPRGLKTVPIEKVLYPDNPVLIQGLRNKKGRLYTAKELAAREKRAIAAAAKPQKNKKTKEVLNMERAARLRDPVNRAKATAVRKANAAKKAEQKMIMKDLKKRKIIK
jgi:hypothetical protein